MYFRQLSMHSWRIFIDFLVFPEKISVKLINPLQHLMTWLLKKSINWFILSVEFKYGEFNQITRKSCIIFGKCWMISNGVELSASSVQGCFKIVKNSIFDWASLTEFIISSLRRKNCLIYVDCEFVKILIMCLIRGNFNWYSNPLRFLSAKVLNYKKDFSSN